MEVEAQGDDTSLRPQGDDTSLREATSAGIPPAQNKWKRASRVRRKIRNKKNFVPLLDRKGETYDPPAIDECSKMCVSLPEFKNLSTYTSTFLHLNSPIPICSDA